MHEPAHMYSRHEVAALIGVAPTTIQAWERSGKQPAPRRFLSGKFPYYTDEDIARLKEYRDLADNFGCFKKLRSA